jgi:hypothetical protein
MNSTTMTTSKTLALGLALLAGCGDDATADTATKTDTGDATSDATDAGTGGDPTSDSATDTDPGTPTTGDADDDGGEPNPPGPDTAEACDAGDEAFVKRLIPLIQGRKPEGMREVRLLVSMIAQLDALGVDGRGVLARGLTSGDLYLRRWRQFMWEQLRINRVEVKSNFTCYSVANGPNTGPDLAAFIRDNAALDTSFGAKFSMADVLESALHLDDISPIYRADMFARMARPLGGANISQEEFEVNARSNFGEIFESAYLGRRSGCLECHNSEESVTYSPDPKTNHFWAIPGNFERAIYGEAKGRPEAELYAVFRVTGFLVEQNQNGSRPWGMSSCGSFDPGRDGDILSDKGYLGGELPAGQNLFDVDPLLKSGFASLAADGLELEDNLEVAPDQALAYLTATNLVNNVWKEMMGYPLTLAHNFPRNEKQREILQTLTEAFVAEDYSLRALLTEIALHPYFNVDAPDLCDTSTAYFLEPVFEPYAPTSADPDRRGNGVGDRVQRFSAWVLIESAMRSMWWPLPVRHVGGQDEFPAIDFLRDQGAFIKDAQNGFNGVDFNGLLSWENRVATGENPQLGGACTGPLGQECATYEWLELMLVEGSKTPGTTIRDLAAAIKDRLIAEPTISDEAELAAIASVMGLDPATKMSEVDTGTLEDAARRFTGLILNTPQFMLSGVPSRDQDPAHDPAFAVPGTDTAALCDQLAPLVLADAYKWSCGPDGVKISR